jgi:hypothetical protein
MWNCANTSGASYIIDLNKFVVVDFLSGFNFYYTGDGGRTYTASNLAQLG